MNWEECISICISSVVSFCIARWVHRRAKVSLMLHPYVQVGKKALGRNLELKASGEVLSNLCVLKFVIKTGRFSGMTALNNIFSNLKPRLRIKGFLIHDIKTLNNDFSKFYIPITKSDPSTIILNINWIRSNTVAEFLISGTLSKNMSISDVSAKLFPGLLYDVDVKVFGNIDKNFDCTNFITQTEDSSLSLYVNKRG